MTFKLKRTKTCRNHLKKWYELPVPVQESLITEFEFLGKPEINDMREFLPNSLVLFRLRSYSFQVELSGGYGGHEIFAIFPKENPEVENLIEETLNTWLQKL